MSSEELFGSSIDQGMVFLSPLESKRLNRQPKTLYLHVYRNAHSELRVQVFSAYDADLVAILKNSVAWSIGKQKWEPAYKSWTMKGEVFYEKLVPELLAKGYSIDPTGLTILHKALRQEDESETSLVPKPVIAKLQVYDTWVHLYGKNDPSPSGSFPTDLVHNWLEKELTYYRVDYQRTERFKSGKWDGKVRLYYERPKREYAYFCMFKRGLLERVQNILHALEIPFAIEDFTSTKDNYFLPYQTAWNFPNQLWPHQERILETCLKFNEGQIESAMGTGKSLIMARLIHERGVATNIFIHRVGIAKQLFLNFREWLGHDLVGFVGESKCLPVMGGINVISLPTAYLALRSQKLITVSLTPAEEKEIKAVEKRLSEEIKTNYSLISAVVRTATMNMYDEGHRLGAETYGAVAQSTLSKYNFIFTATSYRNDGADLELEAGCGPKRVSYGITQAIRDGILMQPLVFMIYTEDDGKPVKTKEYNKEYNIQISDNLTRNIQVVSIAIALAESGRRVLITVKRIKHGQVLEGLLNASGVKAKFVYGAYETDERLEFIQQLVNLDLHIIISNVMGEGIDIKPLGAIIRAKGEGKTDDNGNSSIDVVQETGRVLRLCGEPTNFNSKNNKIVQACKEKKQPIIVDFFDHHGWFKVHSEDREKTYKGEPEFIFINEVTTVEEFMKELVNYG